MRAHQIRLTPIAQSDLPTLHRWANSDAAYGDFDEPSYLSFDDVTSKWDRGGYTTTWMIEQRDKAVGYCSSFHHPWSDWIAVIAVIIAEPLARGLGIGTEAHKRLCQTIFSMSDTLQKIEAYTDFENYAEQRVLEKTGFQQEGRLRRSGLIRGEIRDMLVYGLLR